MSGKNSLLEKLAQATGLPENLVMEELLRLTDQAGKAANELTLDELRTILAGFLQDVLVETKTRLRALES